MLPPQMLDRPGYAGVSLIRQAEFDALAESLKGILTAPTMLEIGTYEGVTTSMLTDLLKRQGRQVPRIVAVDPFIDHGEDDPRSRSGDVRFANWRKNRRPNMSIWVGTVDTFYAFNQLKFDLIFVDGDHRYEAALKDMRYAKMMLQPAGILAVHDFVDWPEVHRAAQTFLSESGMRVESIVDTMALMRF